MRTNSFQHAKIVPHKHVVRNGNSSVFQFFFMFAKIFATIYPQSVCQVHYGKNNEMQRNGNKRTLNAEQNAVWHIGIILVQFNIARTFELQHMRIAALGVCIIEIVTVIHFEKTFLECFAFILEFA